MASNKHPIFFKLATWLLLLFSLAGRAKSAPPFVAGYERFGRFSDIDTRASGNLLIGELSCVACHQDPKPLLQPKRGPNLANAGLAIHPNWLRSFLGNPHKTKPGSTMPNVLGHMEADEKEKKILALVAFLSAQRAPFANPKAGGANPLLPNFWTFGDTQRGEELYHSVGCVACHPFREDRERAKFAKTNIDKLIDRLEPEELRELGLSGRARQVPSIPHSNLNDKYSSQALAMLLLDPSKKYPSGSMPSLRLEPNEAADIAAYLLKGNNPSLPETDISNSKLINEGRELFRELRCANCHQINEPIKANPAKPLSHLRTNVLRGCLTGDDNSPANYQLDSDQTSAILESLTRHLKSNSAGDSVHASMLRLNCYACHERDDLGGVGHFRRSFFETKSQVDMGDEGRLPPPLSGVGRKLTARALQQVFSTKADSYRDFMSIRMPTYHSETVNPILKNLPIADSATTSAPVASSLKKAVLQKAGHGLVNTGCVGCHPFRGESLPDVIGVDLGMAAKRVRVEWFREFLRDPVKLKKRTRMPTFFPDGKSSQKQILDGNVELQIEAMWTYLSDLPNQPLPDAIEQVRSKDFELKPNDRPVILRTFMKDVGTHAIAVGFPGGMNYAFDSESSRFALTWTGRFIDAKGTWFERFAPMTPPLAQPTFSFPNGKPFAVLNTEGEITEVAHDFRGYRLSPAGLPTMLFSAGELQVEDTLAPEGKNWKRLVRVQRQNLNTDYTIYFLIHRSKKLQPHGETSYVNESGLTIFLESESQLHSTIATSGTEQVWLLEMPQTTDIEFSLEYQW